MIVVAVLLALLGPCRATGPPPQAITQEQLHVLNRTLDALHEENVAARTPSTWPFVLFLLTLLLPLVLAVWLLRGAEHSAMGDRVQCGTLEGEKRQPARYDQSKPATPLHAPYSRTPAAFRRTHGVILRRF